MKTLLPLLLVTLFLSACDRQTAGSCEDLIVSDAWIREMPPGPTMTAGYLQIENHGRADVTIQGFSAEDFGRIEMHESRQVDGRMQMRPLPQLVIAAGDIAEMRPGGKHLMLFDPVQPLKAGEQRSFVITCSRDSLPITAEVRRAANNMNNQDHSQHEHH